MGRGKYKNKPTGQRQFSSREDLLAGTSTRPRSFSKAFDTLLRKLQRYVPLGASVADLYAGAGVIRLSLAATRKCRSMRCIEINKESNRSFEKTVARLPNIVDSSISWHHADTSKLTVRIMIIDNFNLNSLITFY
ncbi:putative S-adenosyl-L-methionine-dependent methyltransferase [Rosa chinensis]|uniref:Putative S-adenosyl-L-methionine-dependent methyltransferase n=1 Tax=Rosa chinensis TaxID=74649 RepID=A0A2P6P252_ROSCH|nr:putative S-adenosyl-L-methionine-dependent methyltransferase [Rosa chinensis]